MSVLVVGASGRTGRCVVRGLLARGTEVRAMVRRQAAAGALEALGAQSVVADLGYDVTYALGGCEAVICAAGAGMGGDPEAVDYRGTVRLIGAAAARGARRFILISSLCTGYHERLREALRPFLEAKRKAEAALEASGLDYTVVKPGGLTDDPGTGRLELAPAVPRGGTVPREDVAALVTELFLQRRGLGQAFEVVSGDSPLAECLRRL